MQTNYSVAGLEKNEVFVEGGEIRLEIEGGSIIIGTMDELRSQEPYEDGTYTDEKGVVIPLEMFINNMAITDDMKKNIKRAPRKKVDDGVFTERMSRFHGILFNRLRCEIKK